MQKIVTLILVIGLLVGGYLFYVAGGGYDTVDYRIQLDSMALNQDDKSEGIVGNLQDNEKNMTAILHTSQGDVTVEFMETDAPKTVTNFVKLAKGGFYDGTKFHRVIKNFMIQGGDPLSKDDGAQDRWGTGGPGYQFADEIHAHNKNDIGTLSMANAGPNTNGSQFFINVADNNFLDDKHTVFAKVTGGLDVVQKIAQVATADSDRPVIPITINSITLSKNAYFHLAN
jgi:peptidylprolyl isomerase